MTARLEVITGPMFSGKTERLIAKLHRAQFAKKRVRIIKPIHDTRTNGNIAARKVEDDGTTPVTESHPAIVIRDAAHLLEVLALDDYDVLIVDEAQFFPLDEPLTDCLGYFGRAIRDLLRRRAGSNLIVIVGGLDQYATGEPFGPIPGLMAIADSVEKLSGVCMVCGSDDGCMSMRMVPSKDPILIGAGKDTYQVCCRSCHRTE